MSVQQLNQALLDYQNKINAFEETVNKKPDDSLEETAKENPDDSLLKEQVLALLTSRDIIRLLIVDCQDKLESPNLLLDLDSRLEDLSDAINKVIDLPKARKSFHPTRKAWWWWISITNHRPVSFWDKYDKFFNILSVVFLLLSLWLMFFLSTKFEIGKPDEFAALIASLLTCFTTVVGGLFIQKRDEKLSTKIFQILAFLLSFIKKLDFFFLCFYF